MWERRGRREGCKVGRTHQKARLTIAELFEHGQPDHAKKVCVHRRREESPVCLLLRWPMPPVCSLTVSDSPNSEHSQHSIGWQRRQSLADADTPEFTGITPNDDHHHDNNMIWLLDIPQPSASSTVTLLGEGETTTRPLSLSLFLLRKLTTDNTTHKKRVTTQRNNTNPFNSREDNGKKRKREKNCCWCSRLGGRLRANGYRRYRTRLTSTSTPTNLDGIAAPALFNNTIGLQVLDLSVREPTPPMYSVLCFVCACPSSFALLQLHFVCACV